MSLPNLDSLLTFLGKAILFTANLGRVHVLVDGQDQATVSIEPAENAVLLPGKAQLWERLFSDDLFLLQQAHRQRFILALDKKYTSAVQQPSGLISKLWSKVTGPDAVAEMARQPGSYRMGCERFIGTFEVRASKSLGDQMERVMKKRPSPRATLSILIESEQDESTGFRHPILKALIPTAGEGRVFIGFETHQTTGLALHLLAPLVPTVERESIDLVTPALRLWNVHCLKAARILVRLAWDSQREVSGFVRLLSPSPSTPSPVPGQLLLDGLLSGGDPSLPTQLGIMPASKVKRVPEGMRIFCPTVARLECPDTLENLITASVKIDDITLEDVLDGLDKVEDEAALRACLEWMLTRLDAHAQRRLATKLRLPTDQGLKPLNEISHYAPFDPSPFKLPSNCISYSFQLPSWPHWITPLPVHTFVSHHLDAKPEELLCWVSTHWHRLSDLEQAQTASLLSKLKLPCSDGTMLPATSCFFESVPLASLPRLALGPRRHLIVDDLLRLMGVKGHIPVSDLLAMPQMRLPQLVDYLIAVEMDLTEAEHQLIRQTPVPSNVKGGEKKLLSQLYLDLPIMKLLGLPTLAWESNRPLTEDTEPGRFLIAHGLKSVPPCAALLGAVKGASTADRSTIFSYFIRNHERYQRSEWQSMAFIPTAQDTERLVRPSECFADGESILLGFPVLHPALLPHAHLLGVPSVPDGDQVTKALCELSFEKEQFEKVCEWVGRKISFSRAHLHILSKTSFIPVKSGWFTPNQVFFNVSIALKDIFTTVAVESAVARAFLRQCGVSDQPSMSEIVERLTSDPEGLLEMLGVESYLALLRRIASAIDNGELNDGRLLQQLASGPCLLAQRDVSEWCLAPASRIYLDDDTISRQLFKPLMAPREDPLLQSLYQKLGVKWLSTAVSLRWSWDLPTRSDTPAARELAREIAIRRQLLLSSFPGRLVSDAASLLAQLEVKQVERLQAERSLPGYPTRQQSSTACLQPPRTLIFSHPPDWFDVASALGRILLKDGKLPDCLMLSCLLTTSIPTLQSMGFDVKEKEERVEPVEKVTILDAVKEPTTKGPDSSVGNVKEPPKIPVKLPSEVPKAVEVPNVSPAMPAADASSKEGHSRPKSLFGMLKHGLKEMMKPTTSNPAVIGQLPPHPGNHAAQPDTSIDRTLLKGVAACRPCQEEVITDNGGVDLPPIPTVASAKSTCHSLNGLRRVAIMHSLGIWAPPGTDLNGLIPLINQFAPLQHQLAGLFQVPLSCVNLFWHPSTSVIAFNRSGTLFLSLSFFQHQIDWDPTDTLINWYLTWCHELAHNFVSDHDEMHEHWMMAYAEQYIKPLINSMQ